MEHRPEAWWFYPRQQQRQPEQDEGRAAQRWLEEAYRDWAEGSGEEW